MGNVLRKCCLGGNYPCTCWNCFVCPCVRPLNLACGCCIDWKDMCYDSQAEVLEEKIQDQQAQMAANMSRQIDRGVVVGQPMMVGHPQAVMMQPQPVMVQTQPMMMVQQPQQVMMVQPQSNVVMVR